MLNGVKHLDESADILHFVEYDGLRGELSPKIQRLALQSNSRYHAVCNESSPFLRLSGS